MATTEKKKTGIKQFTKGFWELSRVRQEAFLRNLYDLSPQNKQLFKLRLGKDNVAVLETLKKEIHKETINRIGKFRKLRLSKINEILRNANKYALPMFQQIELKRTAWDGMTQFIISKKYLPDRYQIATARHLDQYFKMVRDHVLEKSEVEDVFTEDQKQLLKLFGEGHYLPHLEDVYIKWFPVKTPDTD